MNIEVRWTDFNVTLHEYPHGKRRRAYCVTSEDAEALARTLRQTMFIRDVDIVAKEGGQ